MGTVLDVAQAHRKAILALVAILLIQFVDQETVDWIVTAVGVLLVGGTPNDPDAVRRLYRKG